MPPAPPSCACSVHAEQPCGARASSPTSHVAAFSPNVVGTACWSSVRAAMTVARCSSASRAHARRGAVELANDELARVPRDEHRGRVEDVLARRAAVRLGDAAPLAQRAHERLDRVARPRVRARASASDVVERGVAERRRRRRPPWPTASARSASSIACSQARDETASRSSSGTKMGRKRLRAQRTPSPARPAGARRSAGRLLPRARPSSRPRPASPGNVQPRQDGLEQAAGEHHHLEAARARRAAGTRTRRPRRCAQRAKPSVRAPELHERVGDRGALAVEHLPAQQDAAAGELVLRPPARARSRRTARRSATAFSWLERRPPEDDVEAVAERPLRLGRSRGRSARPAARAPSGRARS